MRCLLRLWLALALLPLVAVAPPFAAARPSRAQDATATVVGVPFVVRQATGATVYVDAAAPAESIPRALDLVSDAVEAVSAVLPLAELRPAQVFLVADRADFERVARDALGLRISAANFAAVGTAQGVAFHLPTFGGFSLVTHELTHYVIRNRVGSVPHWIDEGLAQWVEYRLEAPERYRQPGLATPPADAFQAARLQTGLQLALAEGLPDPAGLADPIWNERIQTQLAELYGVGLLYTEHILAGDPAALSGYLDALRVGVPGATLAVTGLPLETIYAELQAQVAALRAVNAARQAAGLLPLAWDPAAALAAHRQAANQASYEYATGWDPEGGLAPDRYTRAGGRGYVEEAYALARDAGADPAAAADALVQEILAAPATDPRRRTLLAPDRTSIGIGAALREARLGLVLTVANRGLAALTLAPAGVLAPGERLVVSGRLAFGGTLGAVRVGYLPPAVPIEPLDLARQGTPPEPDVFATLAAPASARDGTFTFEVPLNHPKGAGRYVVWLEVARGTGRPSVPVANSVVVVEPR